MANERTAFHDVRALLDPESIAIVGASVREDSWPARIYRNLRSFGYSGEVYPVNPKYDRLYGVPCYPSVAALPVRADQLIVLVPSDAVPDVLDEAGQRGTRSAVILSGGFSELGTEEGRIRERKMVDAANRHGIRLCGPNVLGNIATLSRTLTFAEHTLEDFQPGGLAFVSQSSGVMGAVLRYATQRGVGISYGIACGNEANTDMADFINFLVDDPQTQVIGLFLEGVRRPDAFVAACRRAAAAGKPVIALKVGRSEGGREAALAHTGSQAGSPEAFDALCEQLAIVQMPGADACVEFAELVTRVRRPFGAGVAVSALSGGVRGLIADICDEIKLPLAPLSSETLGELQNLLGVGSGVGNPLDIGWGGLSSLETYLSCLRLMLRDPSVDVLAVQEELPKTSAAAQRAQGFQAMAELAREHGKGIVFYSRGSYNVTDYGLAFHETCPAPFLQELNRSFEAITRLRWYERQRLHVPEDDMPQPVDTPAAVDVIRTLARDSRGADEPRRL